MASQKVLELPAELAALIMTHLETPRTLFACIRASKRFWHVFRANRVAILAAVIKSAAPEGNHAIAIAACKAAPISRLWWAGAPATDVAESQVDFTKTCPSGRVPEDYPLCDEALLISICKLWWVTDYFLSRYNRDASDIAMRQMPLIENQTPKPMTKSEKARLQRAFFRFEVYRRITPATCTDRDTPDEEYNRILTILRWLPPWGREELLSVQEFLISFVKRVVRDLKCFIVDEVSKMSQTLITKHGPFTEFFERQTAREIETALDLGGFDLWNNISERCIQYLVARGLPFIKWLSSLPPKRSIDTVMALSSKECGPSILEQLVYERFKLIMYDANAAWLEDIPDVGLQFANHGWKWAEAHNLTTDEDFTEPNETSVIKRYVLRRAGYIFWDAARLNNEWNLPFTTPEMLNFHSRRANGDDRDWGKEPSIAKCFENVAVPKSGKKRMPGIYKWLEPGDEWDDQFESRFPLPFSQEEVRLFNIEY